MVLPGPVGFLLAEAAGSIPAGDIRREQGTRRQEQLAEQRQALSWEVLAQAARRVRGRRIPGAGSTRTGRTPPPGAGTRLAPAASTHQVAPDTRRPPAELVPARGRRLPPV